MKAVLFDLDGTLGNTLPLCITAFREAIEPLSGCRLSDEQIIAAFGPSEEGTIATLLPERKAEALHRYLERYEILHSGWPEPFAGVREMLQYLKSRRVFVGLVTGKGPQSAALTLSRYGLADYFEVVKTGEAGGPLNLGPTFKRPPDRGGHRGILVGTRGNALRGRFAQRRRGVQTVPYRDRRGRLGADRGR